MYSLRNLAWTLGIPVEVLRTVARNAVHYYRPFKEHSKGKVREIDNPNYNLKSIQKRIEVNLLKKFQLPDYLHGGISGRSAVTNARAHQGKSYVTRLDIKNFYPSVKHKNIYELWVSMGYGPSVSRVLTALTTQSVATLVDAAFRSASIMGSREVATGQPGGARLLDGPHPRRP